MSGAAPPWESTNRRTPAAASSPTNSSRVGGTKRFQVLRRLGSGGAGVVYEVFDREQGARVALKTLQALHANALLRFKAEFRALQDLRHANLVRLFELFDE